MRTVAFAQGPLTTPYIMAGPSRPMSPSLPHANDTVDHLEVRVNEETAEDHKRASGPEYPRHWRHSDHHPEQQQTSQLTPQGMPSTTVRRVWGEQSTASVPSEAGTSVTFSKGERQ